MDPILFFQPEVCDLILERLTVKEILKASEVSKTWYSFIGSSSKIMKKIKLSFWMDKPRHLSHEIYTLSKSCRNWKSVELKSLIFLSAGELEYFLKSFQNTVEELELVNILVRNRISFEVLDFPKLKSLKITINRSKHGRISEFFVNCKKIEKLCITRNIPCYTPIEKFLSNSFDSLNYLSFEHISSPDILKLIFKIPKLKYLNVGDITSILDSLSKIQLNVNKSIEELRYQIYGNNVNLIKYVFDAVPNLKKIVTFSLTQDVMEYISSNLKELEELQLQTLDVTPNFPSTYTFAKLNKFQIKFITSTVKVMFIKNSIIIKTV